MADLSALAPYADDPDVVAYLQALQAQQQQPMPANSSLPFDAGLTSAYGAADQNYANTIAAIGAQQPGIQRSFGYTASGDIDPNNPYGRAQLLQRSYQQSRRGISNGMAARGQLYSGATQRAQDDAQFNYDANQSALRNDYGQQLAQLSAQRAVAENQRNDAKASAYWDFINAQIQARAANPAGTPPGGGLAPQVGGAAGSPVAPDGTVLDPQAAALAPQVGGAAGPAAPPLTNDTYNYATGNYQQNFLPAFQSSFPAPKPKPYTGPTAKGTGGARYPR